MDCPRCNQLLKRIDRRVPGRPDPKRIFYCEHCGWGKEQLEQKETAHVPDSAPEPDSAPATWLKLGGLWALSAAMVIVPYLLIIQIPSLFSSAYPELFDAGEATARMAEALNPVPAKAAEAYAYSPCRSLPPWKGPPEPGQANHPCIDPGSIFAKEKLSPADTPFRAVFS